MKTKLKLLLPRIIKFISHLIQTSPEILKHFQSKVRRSWDVIKTPSKYDSEHIIFRAFCSVFTKIKITHHHHPLLLLQPSPVADLLQRQLQENPAYTTLGGLDNLPEYFCGVEARHTCSALLESFGNGGQKLHV